MSANKSKMNLVLLINLNVNKYYTTQFLLKYRMLKELFNYSQYYIKYSFGSDEIFYMSEKK